MNALLIIILVCISIVNIFSNIYFFIEENKEEERLNSLEIKIDVLQEKIDNMLKEIDESINNDFTNDNITEVD